MTQPDGAQSERVRIVLADVARGQRPARQELAEQTRVGDALLRGLVRAQFALALWYAAIVMIALGSLPLLFALAPGIAGFRLWGIPLPWLLLGVVAYPLLLGVGWVYTLTSERNEREFADLVERPGRRGD